MNALRKAMRELLRGPHCNALLTKLGIDARRYWLLMDLFDELSERGELLDQLGRNSVALRGAAWMYAVFTAIMAILLISSQPPQDSYLSGFLGLTAFLLLTLLLSEAGNSLVNPVEGLVLAHQPVDGATYTAAKLSHLARIVLFVVPAINGVPALGGLALKQTAWHYPVLHLGAALAVGFLAALLCCALYGWLIRLLPAKRLKAAGQLAGTVPFLVLIWSQPAREALVRARVFERLPSTPVVRWAFSLAVGAAAVGIVVRGIRSLSADYLIRVSGILHGQARGKWRPRKSRTGDIVARLCGGQAARAGFSYVCQMARRDFQFRRQMIPMLAMILLGFAPIVARGWATDPFSGRFTMAHLLPHLFGLVLLFICMLLPYSNDYKAAWVFLLAPGQALRGFARGVHAALCLYLVVFPHLLIFLSFAWGWGVWHAGLFVAFSASLCFVYVAVEVRIIDGAPFSKQVDSMRSITLLPFLMLGAVVIAIVVGLQYFLVFRSAATVAAAAMGVAAAAYVLTRRSLEAFAQSIRYNLALLASESGTLYKEVDI